MRPAVGQRCRIERAEMRPHLGQRQQPRSLGHEQPDRELDWRDVIDEIELIDRVEEVAVRRQRQPRVEGNEGGRQRHAGAAAEGHRVDEAGARVPLVEEREHAVVDRLDRARDKRAPGLGELRHQIGMAKQMLDLDRDVVADLRMLRVQGARDPHRVRRAVEEVGVAKGDVSGARRNLVVEISDNDLRLDDAELAVVDRDDRAMAAEMPAPAARLGVADQAARAVRGMQRGVLRKRRQPGQLRHQEVEARHPLRALRALLALRALRRRVRDQRGLEFPAEDRVRTKRPQPLGVERRIEAERANPRRAVGLPRARDDWRREPRRRVHRQMKANQVRGSHALLRQLLFRDVDAVDVPAGRAQPCGGRGHAERLAPHFVRADEEAAHHARQSLYSSSSMAVAAADTRLHDRAFFGHPRGLSTLFFTEMWERFSYYGMRVLLILFMTAPVAAGGLGFETSVAGAIYGLYTSMVYMTSLPGGWIADRLIGPRRAVLYGGILIASGHFSMAFPTLTTFYLEIGRA